MQDVSIILPYHNREDFLPRTLRSIISNARWKLQIILVDSQSTDSSREICLNFEKKISSSDIEIINISSPNTGASLARNVGLSAATSPYVFFFDSDDNFSPFFLDDALKCFCTSSDSLDIVAAPTEMVFLDGKTKVRYTSRVSSVEDQILSGMLSTQGMLFRREFIKQCGGWNEQLPKWNDWELGIRLLKQRARVMWLNSHYHRIYQHPSSLTYMSYSDDFAAKQLALKNVVPIVKYNVREKRALAVRALLLAEDMRKAEFFNAATLLEKDCPLPSFIRFLLRSCMRIYNKGIWRIAKILIR